MCLKCGGADETMVHALRDCFKARDTLMHGGIDDRVLNSEWITCIDWLESAMRLMGCKAFECFILILWNIWNFRNNFVFRGMDEDSKIVWEIAANFYKEFRLHFSYLAAEAY